jgi:ABC-2 type transport system ATP-binding protein
MSEHAIEIRDLRVDYGKFVAVKDISLSIPFGQVYGLVGPNGAGKTSTFRVITTLMEPTYGEVKVAGFDISEHAQEAREVIGYMPDLAPVPSDLKLWEFLDFYAQAHRIGGRVRRRERVEQCLDAVDLTEKRNDWAKALSRGQTQRLVLAKTLLHDPQVLILDEPASGLDPLSRRDLRLTLQGLANQGRAVFVSSHILTELAEMCSSICVMNQGKILASGSVGEVRAALGGAERKINVITLGQPQMLAQWLEDQPGVREVLAFEDQVSFQFTGSHEDQGVLLQNLVTQGFGIRSFEEGRSSFEDILVEIAGENRHS